MTSVSAASVAVLCSDEEAIAAAHTLAADLAPGAAQRDREGTVPVDALERLRASGLLGITVPREYGGAGVSYETVADVLRILGAADPAIAQVPQNHFGFVGNVTDAGTPEQRELFLGEALGGARFGNAMSERGTRHIAEYRTRLRAAGDGTYRLTGRKYYCTGALTADWIPVVAIDDAEQIVVPFVRRETAGVRTLDDWSAMGQRATRSGTTEFEDVLVAELHVVRDPALFDAPRTRGAFAQLMLAAIALGIAENALEDAAEFVRTRTRPWMESGLDRAADDPHLLGEFGRLAVQLHAAQALLTRAARAVDAAEQEMTPERAGEASVAVAEAKAYGGEVAVRIASDLFALAGTAAADESHDLHRHWRNARTLTLHDPARWKYHHVGNHVVNGAFPPPSAYV